jgi:hypothetical protein
MENLSCKLCKFKSSAAQKLNEEEICLLGDNCAETLFRTGDIIIKQDALSTNIVYRSGLDDLFRSDIR